MIASWAPKEAPRLLLSGTCAASMLRTVNCRSATALVDTSLPRTPYTIPLVCRIWSWPPLRASPRRPTRRVSGCHLIDNRDNRYNNRSFKTRYRTHANNFCRPLYPLSTHAALAARQSSWAMSLLKTLWERGVTPQQIIRTLGPLGEKWAGESGDEI